MIYLQSALHAGRMINQKFHAFNQDNNQEHWSPQKHCSLQHNTQPTQREFTEDVNKLGQSWAKLR